MGAWGRGKRHAENNVPHAGASLDCAGNRRDAPARATWRTRHRRPSPKHPSQLV